MTNKVNTPIEPILNPEDYFDDEPQEGVVYIKPRLDMELTLEQKKNCRDIVLEINKFGVNQRQIIFLIELLGAQLELREHVLAVKSLVDNIREGNNLNDSSILLPEASVKKSIILE